MGLIMFNGAPVTWWSKIARLISTSTAESELVAAGEALKTIAHLRLMCQFSTNRFILQFLLLNLIIAFVKLNITHHELHLYRSNMKLGISISPT